jgi:hypothetical protein
MQTSSWSGVGFLTVDSTNTNSSWNMVRYPRTTHSAVCTCLSNAPNTDFKFRTFTVCLFCKVCMIRSTCFWLNSTRSTPAHLGQQAPGGMMPLQLFWGSGGHLTTFSSQYGTPSGPMDPDDEHGPV